MAKESLKVLSNVPSLLPALTLIATILALHPDSAVIPFYLGVVAVVKDNAPNPLNELF